MKSKDLINLQETMMIKNCLFFVAFATCNYLDKCYTKNGR